MLTRFLKGARIEAAEARGGEEALAPAVGGGGRCEVVVRPPVLTLPVSQACTASQMREPAYAYWCGRIGEVPRMHRKQWEFCYIAQVLARAGMLAPGRDGLGFGVGKEPLAALFASHGCHILATDLEPEEARRSGWVETEQHALGKEALNGRGICPPEQFDRNVRFRFADMNAIPEDIGTFDFIWSACAFEHLGSIAEGEAFIMESARRLRPGGLAVHTTEYNCSSNEGTLSKGSTVLFRRRDIEAMAQAVAALGMSVTMTFDTGNEPLDEHVDVPPYSADNHLKLQIQKWVTTSFGLVIRRGG